ncbi:MAG: sugar phosphate nucleotidyltransferase, partial [Candidatus Scalindua sp.]|nr:sugar phosphate nucleotidyltransferase [Candidatus Scalindua sp.]MCR4345495.1 sugar phosphate nucleotidyltransferase [Candidatus Scalindua sp.]
MKGIVLAGGLGTRLLPLTKITNKHLLPILDKPMIYYPLQTLINAGVDDIMIVTGGNNAGDFLRLLGNGKQFGLKDINYTYQEGEGGIAEALDLAKNFADDEKTIIILGDNIIEKNIIKEKEEFEKQKEGAKILIKKVSNPSSFGVPELDGEKVIGIEEKPKHPKTDCAVIGIYMYDSRVFDIISTLERSERGELEITDVNNAYIKNGTMTCSVLDGWWIDAGSSPENLAEATQLV